MTVVELVLDAKERYKNMLSEASQLTAEERQNINAELREIIRTYVELAR